MARCNLTYKNEVRILLNNSSYYAEFKSIIWKIRIRLRFAENDYAI